MKLYAISDLHLSSDINRQALEALPLYPEDWLILAGDIGETKGHLEFALSVLTRRFRRLLWVPGNHDLWTLPSDRGGLRGEAKYKQLVAICRDYGVLTPEDPYVFWVGEGPACLLAPLFVLYDYSFRPKHVPAERAVEWAAETNVICADEVLLYPDPHPSRSAWCANRCAYTEQRLREASSGTSLVLINHFPLRQDLVQLSRNPRFSVWCGTQRTESWHTCFPVLVVVYGHLHSRGTYFRDGVRFEDVSLGLSPWNWDHESGIQTYLREVFPGSGTL
jgi:3',5'-cyclic AMP phosphodiesterase CpdA